MICSLVELIILGLLEESLHVHVYKGLRVCVLTRLFSRVRLLVAELASTAWKYTSVWDWLVFIGLVVEEVELVELMSDKFSSNSSLSEGQSSFDRELAIRFFINVCKPQLHSQHS